MLVGFRALRIQELWLVTGIRAELRGLLVRMGQGACAQLTYRDIDMARYYILIPCGTWKHACWLTAKDASASAQLTHT